MIRTGIIGLGFIGPAHIEALRRTGLAEITAVADTNEMLARQCADKFGIPDVYTDYRDLVNSPNVDVVHICAPNFLHYEIAKAALEANKHTVCEKPLTINAEQAAELVKIAGRKKLLGVTSYNLRFYPMVQQAKAMIESGRLGKIYAYHGSYLQDWLLFDTDYSWRLDSRVCGKSRAVADIGSHWMDMAEYITGSKITSLCADVAIFLNTRKKPLGQTLTFGHAENSKYEDIKIDTEDFANILFRTDSGIRGCLTVSQVSAGRKNSLQFEADGAVNSIAWNSELPNQMWIGHRDRSNEELIKDPNLMDAGVKQFASFPGGHNEGFPDTSKQLFRKVYEYIGRDGLLHGEIPDFPTFADGLHGIRICDAVIESGKSHTWVDVKS